MKRRTFLQSVLGFMVAPWLPKSKGGASPIYPAYWIINDILGYVYETTTENIGKATQPIWTHVSEENRKTSFDSMMKRLNE